MDILFPTTVQDVKTAVSQSTHVRVCGGRSKTGLGYIPEGCTLVNLSRLHGVLEYEPSEFTFTALAGTPISEIQSLLAEHGQYLPFDPLMATKGATLGGTVAANTAGPGRVRFGGVRDFLLGVQFVDGYANVVRGGGKVVKNAAGFDLPKLMVGSMGRLGILVELTCKVFPQSKTYATLKATFPDTPTALHALQKLTTAALELDGLEFSPPGILWIRMGGLPTTLPTRLDNLQRFLGSGEWLSEAEETVFWQTAREMQWVAANTAVFKIPLTPKRISALEQTLQNSGTIRRYSMAGQVAYVCWPDSPRSIHEILINQGLSGQLLLGTAVPAPLFGKPPDPIFTKRVKEALDPQGKFGD